MVLQNINLDVQPGEILALVGTSGGGKTSLVSLIPRFYDISRGAVCIDGIDIRQASISSLRDQLAIVTQEPILFNDTVRYNIVYGKADATESEIVEAATAAYAYDFIQGFPHGFETMIGKHEELIARQGEYYKLYQMQYSGDNQHGYSTEVVNLSPGY